VAKRRDALILGGVGLAAGVLGALVSPILLQRRRGEAALAAARYQDLSDTTRALADWHNRALICNFWATWCEPCRDEIPVLIRLRKKYSANGVEIVGIGIDRVDKMRQFAAEFKISYPLLVGSPGVVELMSALGNTAGALPFTIVRDGTGAVRFRRLGRLYEGDLEPILGAILQ
jgi:thiol-disulfide isomerase/thioredoxin